MRGEQIDVMHRRVESLRSESLNFREVSVTPHAHTPSWGLVVGIGMCVCVYPFGEVCPIPYCRTQAL